MRSWGKECLIVGSGRRGGGRGGKMGDVIHEAEDGKERERTVGYVYEETG
jgi:hypothetical protein